MSSTVRPRRDCSWAVIEVEELSKTRLDPLVVGTLAESASITCREIWRVMIVSWCQRVNLR